MIAKVKKAGKAEAKQSIEELERKIEIARGAEEERNDGEELDGENKAPLQGNSSSLRKTLFSSEFFYFFLQPMSIMRQTEHARSQEQEGRRQPPPNPKAVPPPRPRGRRPQPRKQGRPERRRKKAAIRYWKNLLHSPTHKPPKNRK